MVQPRAYDPLASSRATRAAQQAAASEVDGNPSTTRSSTVSFGGIVRIFCKLLAYPIKPILEAIAAVGSALLWKGTNIDEEISQSSSSSSLSGRDIREKNPQENNDPSVKVFFKSIMGMAIHPREKDEDIATKIVAIEDISRFDEEKLQEMFSGLSPQAQGKYKSWVQSEESIIFTPTGFNDKAIKLQNFCRDFLDRKIKIEYTDGSGSGTVKEPVQVVVATRAASDYLARARVQGVISPELSEAFDAHKRIKGRPLGVPARQ